MESDQLSRDLASLKIDRNAKAGGGDGSPARKVAWLVVGLAAIVAVGYFVVYPRVTSALVTPRVRLGSVTLVSPAQAQVELTATGYVVALVAAKVAAKVSGRIAEIFVAEGQVIDQGAKVARLEDVDHRSALAAARSRTAAARAKVAIANANLSETRVSIAREEPLVEKGVTAKATLDDLRARGGSLAAMVRAAEADASAAEAEARSLEVQLDSYLITSPIAGTVVAKLVEVGEGVAPGFGTPGVVEVVDMTSLVVEVDVPEGRLAQVAVDAPAEIILDAYPAQRLRGAVKEVGRRVNRAKATVPVKVRFVDKPTDAARVLPEMAARVSFLSAALDPASLKAPPKLVVPSNAVIVRNGADAVFVFDDGNVRLTPVRAGPGFADGRELMTQLPVGTKVVLDPQADLRDGQRAKEQK